MYRPFLSLLLAACAATPGAKGQSENAASAVEAAAPPPSQTAEAPPEAPSAETATVAFPKARAELTFPSAWKHDAEEGWAMAAAGPWARVHDADRFKEMETETGFVRALALQDALGFGMMGKVMQDQGPALLDTEDSGRHEASPFEKLEDGGWLRVSTADDHVHVDVARPRPSGTGWALVRCQAPLADEDVARQVCLSLKPLP